MNKIFEAFQSVKKGWPGAVAMYSLAYRRVLSAAAIKYRHKFLPRHL